MDFKGVVNIVSTTNGEGTVSLDGDRGDIKAGGNGQAGSIKVTSSDGTGSISLDAIPNGGRFRITDSQNRAVGDLAVGLNVAILTLGGVGFDGHIALERSSGKPSIVMSGRDGDIVLNDESGRQTVRLSGPLGDVILSGADTAEEFEIVGADADVTAGTVMVIGAGGRLRTSAEPYDRSVAGVVSGAGVFRPGVILGRAPGRDRCRAIALSGRVYCQAEAQSAPIGLGDLLTSSSVPGYAMKAADPARSHGAVLGKSLEPLAYGRGLIPVLVTLH